MYSCLLGEVGTDDPNDEDLWSHYLLQHQNCASLPYYGFEELIHTEYIGSTDLRAVGLGDHWAHIQWYHFGPWND